MGNFSCTGDVADAITRVGLPAKRGLAAGSSVLAELAGWLEARAVRPVFETETAMLAGVPPGRPTVSRDDLPRECDLLVVLGGDGTLIGWPTESPPRGLTSRFSASNSAASGS